MATVSNPLKADLDGGGHNIANVANFQSAGGAQIGGAGTTCAENVLVDDLTAPTIFVSDGLVGTADPTAGAGLDRNPGSRYVQVVAGVAVLWFKRTLDPHDWQRVAG